MKTKSIIFVAVALLLLLGAAFFVKARYFTNHETDDVKAFMKSFERQVTNRNADLLTTYFDLTSKINYARQLINVLTGVTKVNGDPITKQTNPIIKLKLMVDQCSVTNQDGIIKVVVPVQLKIEGTPQELTSLTFTLQKTGTKQYQIIQVDTEAFIKKYMAFESKYKQAHIPEKDIYSAITLQAFKAANQLKSKYDSVVWFSHINEQTYFYVVNGVWNDWLPGTDSAKTYKMGLVDPKMKEIIPADFDLIYTINGTFNGLVEVEKDHKRGFYDLNGNVVVPVEYDQIYPVINSEHAAALRKNNAYYWLEKNYAVSAEVTISITDLLAMLPPINSFELTNFNKKDLMELNSRENHSSILVSPSYLTDLNLMPVVKNFRNALRKNVDFYDASSLYKVSESKASAKIDTSRFETLVYSIRDYFIGGRSEFYDSNNIVLIDKRNNRIYSKDIFVDYSPEGGEAPRSCAGFAFKPISDSLFELKAASSAYVPLYDESYISEMPIYHYLYIQNNKLKEKATNRMFAFTKFIKMDESYITGCYYYKDKVINELTPAMLKYMKNEIYADYNYQFKDKKWMSIFETTGNYKPEHVSVEDSLTEIDRYNLNWINQRLKVQTATKLAAR